MEIYTLLLGLNWFFIESGLNSAANPKESCKVETKIQSSYKDAIPGEEFGLSFAKGSEYCLSPTAEFRIKGLDLFYGSGCGKACNRVPQRGEIGDQVDPPSFVVETPFHRATPFHQATTERPTGLICVEKIWLARRRLPPTAVPSRSGSEMSAECGTLLYAD